MISFLVEHSMTLFRPAIVAAMLALSVPIAVQAAPAVPAAAPLQPAAAPLGAAHAAAVRDMLEVLHSSQMMRHVFRTIGAPGTSQWELVQHMAQHTTDDEIYARLVPLYAKHVSASEATLLARSYDSGPGKREVMAMLARQGVVEGETHPQFTAGELAELQRIAALPVSRKLGGAQAQIGEDSRRMGEQWARQYQQDMGLVARASLSEFVAAVSALEPGGAVPPLTPKPTGLASVDKLLAIIAQSTLAMMKANYAYLVDTTSYDMGNVLDPQRLVSAEGLALSNASLVKFGARLEAYLQEIAGVQERGRQGLLTLTVNADTTRGIEQELAVNFDFMLRMGENQRGVLDLLTRMLRFAESRQGAIVVQDGILAFRDDGDLEKYRALIAQLKKAVAEETNLTSEAEQKRQRILKSLEG